MTLRHLEIFVAVADAGSMTAASEKLYISQPTVSQAIMELERYYGTKLFDRMGKKLYRTQAGERLLSYARHVTSLVSDMALQMTQVEATGVLRVGASATVGILFLPEQVKRFQQAAGSIQIQAVVKNTLDIEQHLLKNELDIGLVEGDIHSSDLLTHPFAEDELVIVCGQGNPFYGKKKIDPHALQNQSYLMREVGSGTRELFEYAMAVKTLSWQTVWESNSFESIKRAAIADLGLAVLSRELVSQELASGALWHISTPFLNLKRNWTVVYHKNKYLTAAMQAFIHSSCEVKRVSKV